MYVSLEFGVASIMLQSKLQNKYIVNYFMATWTCEVCTLLIIVCNIWEKILQETEVTQDGSDIFLQWSTFHFHCVTPPLPQLAENGHQDQQNLGDVLESSLMTWNISQSLYKLCELASEVCDEGWGFCHSLSVYMLHLRCYFVNAKLDGHC